MVLQDPALGAWGLLRSAKAAEQESRSKLPSSGRRSNPGDDTAYLLPVYSLSWWGGEWLVTGAQESVPEERGFFEEGRGESWPLYTFSLPKCQEPPAGMVCS